MRKESLFFQPVRFFFKTFKYLLELIDIIIILLVSFRLLHSHHADPVRLQQSCFS